MSAPAAADPFPIPPRTKFLSAMFPLPSPPFTPRSPLPVRVSPVRSSPDADVVPFYLMMLLVSDVLTQGYDPPTVPMVSLQFAIGPIAFFPPELPPPSAFGFLPRRGSRFLWSDGQREQGDKTSLLPLLFPSRRGGLSVSLL